MRNTRPLPCQCCHPKSIHARTYFKVKLTNLPSHCNFPGCNCKGYAPAQPKASTA